MLQSSIPVSSDLFILVIASVVIGNQVLRDMCGFRFPLIRLGCRVIDHSIVVIIIVTIVAVRSDLLKSFEFGRFAVPVIPVGLER